MSSAAAADIYVLLLRQQHAKMTAYSLLCVLRAIDAFPRGVMVEFGGFVDRKVFLATVACVECAVRVSVCV